MISVDSNIIFSAFNVNDANHTRAVKLISKHAALEPLVVSPMVFAELNASKLRAKLIEFLADSEIEVFWDVPELIWERAGIAFGEYATKRLAGVLPRRILADFLIGAHAEQHSLKIMTFDSTAYSAVFPALELIA